MITSFLSCKECSSRGERQAKDGVEVYFVVVCAAVEWRAKGGKK
jgi:hypothetical protein